MRVTILKLQIVACVLLCTALLWQPGESFALSTGNIRQLTRGLLWAGYRNNGTQGRVLSRTDSRSATSLAYPGAGTAIMLNMAGPDYIEYWGIKAGYSWWDQKQEAQNVSAGDGVWVMTKVGSDYGVSYSGLYNPTDDIVPMFYDIENSNEQDWGYATPVPPHGSRAGTVMGNYYPGAPAPTANAEESQPFELLNFRFDEYMDADKDNRPENIIISKWTTMNGVTITRKAMSWSYQGFDDFIIVDLEFENTGDSDGDGVADVNGGAGYDLTDAYFGVASAFVVSQGSVGNQGLPGDRGGTRPNDDNFRYTEAPGYNGAGAGLKANYQFDGDSADEFAEDTGDPTAPTSPEIALLPGSLNIGQVKAYQYVGVAPLAYRDAGAAHAFNANDVGKYVNPDGEQPFTSRWWDMTSIRRTITNAPRAGVNTHEEMYNMMTAPAEANPSAPGAQVNAQTYGPYSLSVGDKAKLVLAYFGGTGANTTSRSDVSAYSEDIETWVLDLLPLDDAARVVELEKGEGVLFDHLKAAQFAYDNVYDLPDYPPDVSFDTGANADAQNEISWPDVVESSHNPDYGTADVAGYRIFRSTWHEFGPWSLIEDIPKGASGADWDYAGGVYKWHDATAAAGFRYFYNVRTYASPHDTWSNGISTEADLPAEVLGHLQAGLEGGYSSSTQRSNLVSSPFQPVTPEGDALQKQIRVVPNPFSLAQAGYNYQSSLKIRFVGIPSKCTIRIYNFSGELVSLINHDDPASGEDVFFHKEQNLASLEIATGIYFYIVESFTPESLGEKARGTFYIIR